MKKDWKSVVGSVWDWPLVSGNTYSVVERHRLKRLQGSFASAGGILFATGAYALGGTVGHVIAASAVGVVGGRYLAGAVTEFVQK